jgi:hypothetical protein
MKRIIVYLLPLVLLVASCSKEDATPLPPVDESQWLKQERAFVVEGGFGCDYYLVQTNRGYSLLRNWGGFTPAPGSILYGDFSSWGVKTFYNRSGGYLLRADVQNFWMSYFQAYDELNFSCSRNP